MAASVQHLFIENKFRGALFCESCLLLKGSRFILEIALPSSLSETFKFSSLWVSINPDILIFFIDFKLFSIILAISFQLIVDIRRA